MINLLSALLFIPLLGASIAFIFRGACVRFLAFVFALLQMFFTFYLLACFNFSPTVDDTLQYEIQWPWSNYLRSSVHFGIDGMSMLMVLLTNILIPLIILSSFNEKKPYSHNFYALILLMQFGLLGVFTALDGILFYAFWEITLIPIWFIAGIWGQKDQKFRFTTKFFVYTFAGSLFMLAGLIYVYALPDTASFALTDLYNANLTYGEQVIVFFCIFFAFAVKLPIFPFHTWQPDTYTFSPTQGSMLLSGLMLKMAVYGLLRYLLPVTPEAIAGTAGGIVIMFCVFGVIYGALIAGIQNDVKRLIAYSSLSHVGLITAGIFSSALLSLNGKFTTEGGSGAMVQAFAHGINVVGLFYCADILEKRFGTRDIRKMGGYAKVAPKFSVLFILILFGSLGVPLTNGFVGEFILIKSVFDYSTLLGIISGLTIILAAVYLLRLFAKTMLGRGEEKVLGRLRDISGVEFSVLASLCVFVVLLGIFPQPILEMVDTSLRFIYSSMIK
ncbi:MAG: NADH-quinone oxidoreductase subunit M [Bergeyella sp.]|nr:NADH-quinone oxidoreductase subunit M [Bergeyella sp.]